MSETSKPKVLLIGSGGVGTIVAYGIHYVGKADLSIVVRRDYQTVMTKGYELNSCDYGKITGWKPDHVYPSVAEAGNKLYDFVVITTKNLADIEKLEDVVEPVVTPGKTVILLMQNGFDLARPFFAKYPQNVVLSGISHIGSHNHNGIITQSQQDRTVISYFENPNLDPKFQEAETKRFISIYSNDKNNCNYYPDAKEQRYRKLVYNATFNTICTLTGVDTGRLENAGGLDSVALPAMREVIRVAKADGVTLPEDIINTVVHSDDADWFEPSMLVDSKKGNPLEIEAILGNLLRVARELKVETPVLDIVYNMLKVVQYKLKEGKGLFELPKDRPISDRYYS